MKPQGTFESLAVTCFAWLGKNTCCSVALFSALVPVLTGGQGGQASQPSVPFVQGASDFLALQHDGLLNLF
jgi:hypothetical protein